mgnify:CR=1 FL=1
MKKAVFPGSFDPITLGHVDIIERGVTLFDELIIAIGINADKKYMFSLEERKKFIEESFKDNPKIKVATYKGLTVDFCKENDIEFYAVNKNFPEEDYDEKYSRKIHADLFIDDRNIGGFIGWTEVYKLIFNYEPPVKKKKGFFSFFK